MLATPLACTDGVHHGSSIILLGDTGVSRPAPVVANARAASRRGARARRRRSRARDVGLGEERPAPVRGARVRGRRLARHGARRRGGLHLLVGPRDRKASRLGLGMVEPGRSRSSPWTPTPRPGGSSPVLSTRTSRPSGSRRGARFRSISSGALAGSRARRSSRSFGCASRTTTRATARSPPWCPNHECGPGRVLLPACRRHLAPRPHEDPSRAAAAVFNRAYPHGMPMAEYARKTLEQARRAQPVHRKRMLAELARYQDCRRGHRRRGGRRLREGENSLERLRDAARRTAPPRACPARRRPAPGSVVVAQAGRAPFTISNVRWASDFVIQRWMHQDDLGSLVRRLAASPGDEPLVIAVAGRSAFSPSYLSFSSRRRLLICRPEGAEPVDTDRVGASPDASKRTRPRLGQSPGLRALCRERAAHRGRRPDRREAPSIRRKMGRGCDRAPRSRPSRDRSRDPRPRRPREV